MTHAYAPEDWRPGFAKRAPNFGAVCQQAISWEPDESMTVWRVKDAIVLGTPELTMTERCVLLAYAAHLGQDRMLLGDAYVWPSAELIATKKLTAVAVSSPNRSSTLPDVATVAEQGVPGFEAGLWMALVMPPKTPADIARRFNEALNKVLASDKMRASLLVQGLEPEPGPPERVSERIRSDIVKWRSVIAKAGIKTE